MTTLHPCNISAVMIMLFHVLIARTEGLAVLNDGVDDIQIPDIRDNPFGGLTYEITG